MHIRILQWHCEFLKILNWYLQYLHLLNSYTLSRFELILLSYYHWQNNDYNSIMKVFTDLMHLSVDKYVYANQFFYYVPPLAAMPVAYMLDRYDLKKSMRIVVALIAVRNLARVLLFMPNLGPEELWTSMRFIYWIVANITMNFVMVLYYCLPLKVSEDWFSKEERSVAWTCILLMPILGTALSALTVPHFVSHVGQVNRLAYMQIATYFISAFAILIGITRSKPETGPPSERKAKANLCLGSNPISMSEKLRRLACNKDIWLHIFALQTFQAIMGTINTVAQDLFKSAGLGIVFCGQLLASMNILTVVFQLISSARLERRANKEEQHQQQVGQLGQNLNSSRAITLRCKMCLTLQCSAFLLYAIALNVHLLRGAATAGDDKGQWIHFVVSNQWLLLIAFSTLYVLALSWSNPNYNEQAARMIAGSVTEATYGAAGTVSHCVTQTIFSSAFVALRYDTDVDDGKGHKHSEYWRSILFVSLCAVTMTSVYVVFFEGKQSETTTRQQQRQRQLDSNSNNNNTPSNGCEKLRPHLPAESSPQRATDA